jgi:hypothetical protein
MKTEAIGCCHGCFLWLSVSKFAGKQGERILVVGVRV